MINLALTNASSTHMNSVSLPCWAFKSNQLLTNAVPQSNNQRDGLAIGCLGGNTSVSLNQSSSRSCCNKKNMPRRYPDHGVAWSGTSISKHSHSKDIHVHTPAIEAVLFFTHWSLQTDSSVLPTTYFGDDSREEDIHFAVRPSYCPVFFHAHGTCQ
jgi:hypothetical protein